MSLKNLQTLLFASLMGFAATTWAQYEKVTCHIDEFSTSPGITDDRTTVDLTAPLVRQRIGQGIGQKEVIFELPSVASRKESDGYFYLVSSFDVQGRISAFSRGFSSGRTLGVPAESGLYHIEIRRAVLFSGPDLFGQKEVQYVVEGIEKDFWIGETSQYKPEIERGFHAALQPLLRDEGLEVTFPKVSAMATFNNFVQSVSLDWWPLPLAAVGGKSGFTVALGEKEVCRVETESSSGQMLLRGARPGVIVQVRPYIYFMLPDGRTVRSPENQSVFVVTQ